MDTKEFVRTLLADADCVRKGTLPTGGILAGHLRDILRFEKEPGGPYVIPVTQEPDVGLNLAIESFLDANDVHLPKLDEFLDRATATPYHVSRLFTPEEIQTLMHDRQARMPFDDNSLPAAVSDTGKVEMVNLIHEVIDDRLLDMSPSFEFRAKALLKSVMERSTDGQISLMPYYLRSAIGEEARHIADETIAELGFANACFWAASIVYEDFWDEDEDANPELLPIANWSMRQFTNYFRNYSEDESGFGPFFTTLMNRLDDANEWEITRCRLLVEDCIVHVPRDIPFYGDRSKKFYPAAGHVLGPVAVLIESGVPVTSDEVSNLVLYFRHCLIARQMNDDAHDWKEDLERGHISTAVAELLLAWKSHYPERTTIDLEEDMAKLEQLFWFDVLPRFCRTILSHSVKARKALTGMSSLERPELLEQFIIRNERVAQEAMSTQARSVEFIQDFINT